MIDRAMPGMRGLAYQLPFDEVQGRGHEYR
jgi:hypothetical protein